MIRKLFFRLHQEASSLRGNEIYRIEALSDAVFAFSVSLLIMSLEVPESFDEFRQTLLNFPSFMATVGLVFFFWFLQHNYFRTYGINSGWIIFLNLCLLTIILFYAFPLKYMFALLLTWLTGINFFSAGSHAAPPLLSLENFSELVIFFSIGYSIIWFIFVLMYRHAYKLKATLKLSHRETAVLSAEINDAIAQCLIGGLAIFFGILEMPMASGICFLMIPIWLLVNNRMLQNKLKHITE